MIDQALRHRTCTAGISATYVYCLPPRQPVPQRLHRAGVTHQLCVCHGLVLIDPQLVGRAGGAAAAGTRLQGPKSVKCWAMTSLNKFKFYI